MQLHPQVHRHYPCWHSDHLASWQGTAAPPVKAKNYVLKINQREKMMRENIQIADLSYKSVTNLDIIVVGKEHSESVDSHSPTTCRRKSVLQSSAEGLVDSLRLVISCCFVLKFKIVVSSDAL
jgi:hypothetical protein